MRAQLMGPGSRDFVAKKKRKTAVPLTLFLLKRLWKKQSRAQCYKTFMSELRQLEIATKKLEDSRSNEIIM